MLHAARAGRLHVCFEARPDPGSGHRDDNSHYTCNQSGAIRPTSHGENSKVTAVTVPMKYGLRPCGRIQATSPVKGTCTPSTVR